MHELKLRKALGALIKMEIGLFLSDNQYIEGVLLDIKQDHIVVDVNQHIFYFALQHIQALSKNAKDYCISSEIVHYVDRNYLVDVLKALRYNWVSINSLSDKVLFGVLSKISDDHVTVINNSELLYIPKAHLSIINSNLSEEQIILVNTQEQPAIEDTQIEDEITSEHTQKTEDIERVSNREVSVLEIVSRKGMEDEKDTNEQSESQQKTRVEMYAALVKLLKHNLLNKDVENERRDDIFQETALQDVVLNIDDKSKGKSNSYVIEVQDCHVEEKMIVEHTERVTNREVSVLEIVSRKGMEDKKDTNEQSESQQKTRVEMYAALVKLLKHNLLNRDVENECREDIFQETALQGVVLNIDDKSKGKSNSYVIEVQDCQVEEKMIVEHTQTINETNLIKSLEVPVIEGSVGEGTEIENVTKENSEVNSRTVSSEVPNLSRLVKHDLPKKVSDYSLEEDHPGVLESSNQEEQLLPTKSIVKRKEKRLLLSAWSIMNNNQYASVNRKNIAIENETPNCEGDPIKTEKPIETEQPSDPINTLIQPLLDQYLNEDIVTLEEKRKSAETTIIQSPVIRICPKAKKEILEKQYYALMKQAETKCFRMSEGQLNPSREEQYHALMKHAAKMYHEFKD